MPAQAGIQLWQFGMHRLARRRLDSCLLRNDARVAGESSRGGVDDRFSPVPFRIDLRPARETLWGIVGAEAASARVRDWPFLRDRP